MIPELNQTQAIYPPEGPKPKMWVTTNHLTALKMTSAQIVETSVNVISNSPSQDYTHPDDRTLLNYDVTPRFKPFMILLFMKLHQNK